MYLRMTAMMNVIAGNRFDIAVTEAAEASSEPTIVRVYLTTPL